MEHGTLPDLPLAVEPFQGRRRLALEQIQLPDVPQGGIASGMAGELLDVPHRDPLGVEEGDVGGAERMRVDLVLDPHLGGIPLEHLPEGVLREPLSLHGGEEPLAVPRPDPDPRLDGVVDVLPERQDALLPTFTTKTKAPRAGLACQGLILESAEFAPPKAGIRVQNHHRVVALSDLGVPVRLPEQLPRLLPR